VVLLPCTNGAKTTLPPRFSTASAPATFLPDQSYPLTSTSGATLRISFSGVSSANTVT
jgi:hypothetical protein